MTGRAGAGRERARSAPTPLLRTAPGLRGPGLSGPRTRPAPTLASGTPPAPGVVDGIATDDQPASDPPSTTIAPTGRQRSQPVPSAPRRERQPGGHRWSTRGCLLPLLALLALLALAGPASRWTRDHGPSSSSSSASTQTASSAGAPTAGASTPTARTAGVPSPTPTAGPTALPVPTTGPVNLPAPFGTVPRTRPLVVVLLVDPYVAPAQRAAVAEEVERFRRYAATYAIPGDRIALQVGDAPPTFERPGSTSLARSVAAIGRPASLPAADPSRRALLASTAATRYPKADRLYVAVGPDAARWATVLPPGPTDLPPGDPGPRDLGAIERLDAAATSGPTLPVPSTVGTPPVTTVSAARGQLATALARAWVLAYGGGWPGG